MSEESPGTDLSGLHRELDRLKNELCRCNHEGSCLACRGFEVVREQAQMVVAAASQPVLMQVAQEASVKDLMGQLGGLQEKLAGDPELHDLMARMLERIQEDVGGREALERLFGSMGLFGQDGPGTPGPMSLPPDDRPPSTPPA